MSNNTSHRPICLAFTLTLASLSCSSSGGAPDTGVRRDAPASADTGLADTGAVDTGGADTGDDADTDPAIDGSPGGDVMSCGFHTKTGQGREVMRLDAADGKTQVLIVREATGSGIGFSTNYTLLAFAVLHAGKLHCIDEAKDLHYVSTHHNWVDEAEATVGAVRYHLDLDYQPTGDAWPPVGRWVWTYRLRGYDTNGTPLWGPIDLGCADLYGKGCGQ